MPRRYAAYLLRRWTLDDGRERVEVQVLPTGESRRYGSLAEACAWLQRAPNSPSIAPEDGRSPPTAVRGDPAE